LKQEGNHPKGNAHATHITSKTFRSFPEIEEQEYGTSKHREINKVRFCEGNKLVINILQGRQDNQAIQAGHSVDAVHEIVGVQYADKENIGDDY
jgi:hypothetical protein